MNIYKITERSKITGSYIVGIPVRFKRSGRCEFGFVSYSVRDESELTKELLLSNFSVTHSFWPRGYTDAEAKEIEKMSLEQIKQTRVWTEQNIKEEIPLDFELTESEISTILDKTGVRARKSMTLFV